MSNDYRFNVACPGCGAEVAVSSIHIGKKGRCPKCQTVFPILEPASVPPLGNVGPGELQPLAAWPVSSPQEFAQPAPSSPFAPAGYPANGDVPATQDDAMRFAPVATAASAPLPYQDSLQNAYQAPQAAPAQSGGGEGSTGSILAGIGMMVGAVVWFVVALLFFDVIFFYPPILFILGLIAFVRGIVNLFNR